MSKQEIPSFGAGYAFVIVLSVAVAVFGVWGWFESDANLPQKLLMSVLSLAVAFAIPTTAQALGKSWASLGSLAAVCIFGLVTAYSTHNGYVELIDKPSKVAYMASTPIKESEAAYAKAIKSVETAQANLTNFTPKALPTCTCPQTVKATAEANVIQRAPLESALEAAKVDRDDAKIALEAKRNAYKPMAPDGLVWLVGALIDLGIVLAIFGFEMTKVSVERRNKREADKAAQLNEASELLKDELDEEMEELRQDAAFYRGLESEMKIYDLNDHLKTRGEEAA